jgi:ADP-heptose:LPS heptosyltransferase
MAIKKILLVRNDHIGDMVLATPVFREIRKKFPNIIMHVLASKQNKVIIENNKTIDKIITCDFFWKRGKRDLRHIFEYFKILAEIRREKYDLVIDLRSDIWDVFFIMYLGRIKQRITFKNRMNKFLLTSYLPYSNKHVSKENLDLVNFALKMNSKNYSLEIITNKEDKREVKNFIIKNNLKKYVCIAPGASAKLQTWDKNKFKKIIEWMKIRYPSYKVILTGGSEDERLIDWLAEGNKNCIKLINFNIRRLGLLFRKSSVVLLHDGGPMHIAYTMNTPKLIVLWGPNPLEQIGPLKYFRIIHHKLDCYPCMRKEKDCKRKPGSRCMDLITVEEVKKAIGEAIK